MKTTLISLIVLMALSLTGCGLFGGGAEGTPTPLPPPETVVVELPTPLPAAVETPAGEGMVSLLDGAAKSEGVAFAEGAPLPTHGFLIKTHIG